MYYRRKIALALLEEFGGELGKLDFQKLLFLLSKRQALPSFDFVPYKFGCYSFQANADLFTMTKYLQIQEKKTKEGNKGDRWCKTDPDSYFKQLKKEDQAAILTLKADFGAFTTTDLIRYTYRQFPYYAINSTIAHRVLSDSEIEKVNHKRPSTDLEGLFTIGYEGVSLEAYLNKLLEKSIVALCDVRKNSKSMKFGFSKNQLAHGCEGVGIKYYHFPNLGIDTEKRKNLDCQQDYDALFKEYRESDLPNKTEDITLLAQLVQDHGRVALTCFEANIHQCHRKHLADKVVSLPGWHHPLMHL